MLKVLFRKSLCCYLALALFALSLPATGWAMFLPADTATLRTEDLSTVRTTLESNIVKQRLLDYGLTAEQVSASVDRLSDEQLHRLATNIDSVQAGGDGLGGVIFILLVVIIVIVVLEATGHHIVVK
ncbi:MAG: PA2779 family protein [Nitrospirota bacterium]|nr:PA2779 family protein [Nitrospirota bacterium]